MDKSRTFRAPGLHVWHDASGWHFEVNGLWLVAPLVILALCVWVAVYG